MKSKKNFIFISEVQPNLFTISKKFSILSDMSDMSDKSDKCDKKTAASPATVH